MEEEETRKSKKKQNTQKEKKNWVGEKVHRVSCARGEKGRN